MHWQKPLLLQTLISVRFLLLRGLGGNKSCPIPRRAFYVVEPVETVLAVPERDQPAPSPAFRAVVIHLGTFQDCNGKPLCGGLCRGQDRADFEPDCAGAIAFVLDSPFPGKLIDDLQPQAQLPFWFRPLNPGAALILHLNADMIVVVTLDVNAEAPSLATRVAVDNRVGSHLGQAQHGISGQR